RAACPSSVSVFRAEQSHREATLRILVVEDDKPIASFIGKGLREGGFAVDHAGDGEAGLDLALAEPYDVAIVDLMLPGLDGLSLIEQLRRRDVTTPVLVLSARRAVDDRVKGLQSGGDAYLTKPFAVAELLARGHALRGDIEPPGADSAHRGGSRGRPLDPRGDPGRESPRPPEARVLPARVPGAERGTSRFQDDDPPARVGSRLRSSDQRRRGPDFPPADQGRRRVVTENDSHGARHRICPSSVLSTHQRRSASGSQCGPFRSSSWARWCCSVSPTCWCRPLSNCEIETTSPWSSESWPASIETAASSRSSME